MSGLKLVLACAVCWVVPSMTLAQGYPIRPVFLVVPYSAGGGMDIFVRAVGQRMSDAWGQPVQVENRPGANAIIGTEHVVKAAPEGYTLLVSDPSLVNNSSLYTNLPYEPLRDLVPITGLVTTDLVVVVTPSLSMKTLKDFIDHGKANPGKLSYASIGVGSSFHLAVEMLQSMAGIQMNHIPYKGTAPALVDLTAGHVQMSFSTIASALPYVKSGKLRMLAVGRAKRSTKYPELPTVAEAGPIPGYDVSTWFGLHAPTGTPRPVIDRVNSEANRIMADSAFRERNLDPQGFEPLVSSPEQFAGFIKSETLKWGKVVRDAKVKLD